MTIRLADWSAKRSGATITVRGVEVGGPTRVVTDVVEIVRHPARTIAIRKDGDELELV